MITFNEREERVWQVGYNVGVKEGGKVREKDSFRFWGIMADLTTTTRAETLTDHDLGRVRRGLTDLSSQYGVILPEIPDDPNLVQVCVAGLVAGILVGSGEE